MSLNLLLITARQRNGPVKSQVTASPRFLIKQTSCLHLAVSSLELLLFTPSLELVLFRCYFLNRVGGAALYEVAERARENMLLSRQILFT